MAIYYEVRCGHCDWMTRHDTRLEAERAHLAHLRDDHRDDPLEDDDA